MDQTETIANTDIPISAAQLPVLSTSDTMALERVELRYFVQRLKSLTPDQWEAPTRQPDRDVHAVVAHVAGSYALQSNLRQIGRQIDPRVHRFYRTPGQSLEDAFVRVQIGDRLYWRPERLIAEIESTGERAIRLRSLLLRPLQRVSTEQFTRQLWIRRRLSAQAHLLDLWLHRLEVADATGTSLITNNAHDRQIFEATIASVAVKIERELASRRIDLTITGLSNVRYQYGIGEEPTSSISISTMTLAKRIAGWHSPAATRERSTIQGDVRTAMELLKLLTTIHKEK